MHTRDARGEDTIMNFIKDRILQKKFKKTVDVDRTRKTEIGIIIKDNDRREYNR